jgi:hypothetical protein
MPSTAKPASPTARRGASIAKETQKPAVKASAAIKSKASVKSPKTTTLYRFLVGLDDASFCHRVSDALSKGWQLHGSSSLVFDATTGKVMCGQPVIKTIRGPYSPAMKLSEQ